MLVVSGELDAARPAGSLVAQEIGDRPISLIGLDTRLPADLDGSRHRSVYLPVLRDRLPDVLDLFDFAEPSLVTGDRETTNVPVQALYLMNSPFVQARAEALADRLTREADDDDAAHPPRLPALLRPRPGRRRGEDGRVVLRPGQDARRRRRERGVASSSPPSARPCCRPPNSGTSIRESVAHGNPTSRRSPAVARLAATAAEVVRVRVRLPGVRRPGPRGGGQGRRPARAGGVLAPGRRTSPRGPSASSSCA